MPMQAPATPPGPAPSADPGSPVPGGPRPGSIVRRLVVFGLGLAVPILIFGGVVLWQFADAARERLEAEALGRARVEAAAVDREIASLIATLEALSLSNALQRGDVTAFREQVQELARRSGLPAILRDSDGRRLIDLGDEPMPERLDAADASALTGRAAVSGVIDGHVRVTVPVRRRGGDAVLYLLSFSLPTARLRDVLVSGGVAKAWVITIIDGDQRIVTRTRSPERFTGTPAPEELRRATGPEGHWRGASLEGEPFFAAYAGPGCRIGASPSGCRRRRWRPRSGPPGVVRRARDHAGGDRGRPGARLRPRHRGPLHALRDQAVALGLGRAAPVLTGVPAEVAAVSAEIAGAAQRQRERTAERARAASALRAETQRLEVLNRLGTALSSELDRQRLGDAVVEAATHLTAAAYGALFERVPEGPDGRSIGASSASPGAPARPSPASACRG